MSTIIVKVENKIATNRTPEVKIVCGNSDYVVNFEFDEEWSGQNIKTALFAYNNGVEPVVFEGNSCEVPILRNTTLVGIGVKAGDLRTTTPAYADCLKSISDIGGEIAPPEKNVYDQIMELLNKALSQNTAVPMGGKKNQVLAKKSDDDFDTYWADDQAGVGGATEETVREIVSQATSDLQPKTDDGLNTTDKTIVGAINEINEKGVDEEALKVLIESLLPTIEEEY